MNHINFAIPYLLLLLFYAAILGRLSYIIVRHFKLDLKTTLLRFSNHWHYYFSGEVLKFKDFEDIATKDSTIPNKYRTLATYGEILIRNTDSSNVLYRGLIRKYIIKDETTELEHLFLTDISRFPTNSKRNNKKNKPSFSSMSSDILIIPGKDIVNISLNYILTPEGKQNYSRGVINVISIIVLIIFMWDGFGFFADPNAENPDVLRAILIRFLIFVDWLFLITVVNAVRNKKSSKQRGVIGLLTIFFIIITVGLIYLSS